MVTDSVDAQPLKYIRMGTSSAFGNMFSMLGASILLPFLPMQPVQILLNNLLYDFSQTGIPFDNVDPEDLRQPRQWQVGGIRRFMLFIGPVSSLFDYAALALMWFVESLMTQTLIVHVIRTLRIPFLQSRPSLTMTLATLVVMAIGIALPFTPIGAGLNLVPLPYFAWLAWILLGYITLTQLVKSWFVSRFGYA